MRQFVFDFISTIDDVFAAFLQDSECWKERFSGQLLFSFRVAVAQQPIGKRKTTPAALQPATHLRISIKPGLSRANRISVAGGQP